MYIYIYIRLNLFSNNFKYIYIYKVVCVHMFIHIVKEIAAMQKVQNSSDKQMRCMILFHASVKSTIRERLSPIRPRWGRSWHNHGRDVSPGWRKSVVPPRAIGQVGMPVWNQLRQETGRQLFPWIDKEIGGSLGQNTLLKGCSAVKWIHKEREREMYTYE